jgi:integrase
VECRFHDLRHAFATWLLNTVSWEQLPTVSRMLGHASPATTSRIYAHGVTEAERGLAARIGRMVAGELEP